MKTHSYNARILWTGNKGTGTSAYDAYSRNHNLIVDGKPVIPVSSDTIFLGDADRHNPEELLIASLSSCHMLWYLHLCSDAGVIVKEYSDIVRGFLCLPKDEPGYFSEVTLNPVVLVSKTSMIEKAIALHHEAHKQCFIANSCNFPVRFIPTCISEDHDSN